MTDFKTKPLTDWVFQLDKMTGRLTVWRKTGDKELPMTAVITLKKQAWKSLIRFLEEND